MKTTILKSFFALVLAVFVLPNVASAQCDNAPTLTIQSDSITVTGEVVHIAGTLPEAGGQWFYTVSCRSSRLFNFSLWKIIKFNDRDGYFLAKSWNLQVLDSHEHPEKEVIFDRENEFYFWGDVAKTPEGQRVKVDSIVGLPDGIRGDVMLREVHREDGQGHTAHP